MIAEHDLAQIDKTSTSCMELSGLLSTYFACDARGSACLFAIRWQAGQRFLRQPGVMACTRNPG